MPTTIHLPADLLQRVDRRANALGFSRNRYIRRALEGAVESEAGWSTAFMTMLAEAAGDGRLQEGVAELRRVIASGRRSRRRPPRL